VDEEGRYMTYCYVSEVVVVPSYKNYSVSE